MTPSDTTRRVEAGGGDHFASVGEADQCTTDSWVVVSTTQASRRVAGRKARRYDFFGGLKLRRVSLLVSVAWGRSSIRTRTANPIFFSFSNRRKAASVVWTRRPNVWSRAPASDLASRLLAAIAPALRPVMPTAE